MPPAHLFVLAVPNPGAFVDKGAIKLAGVSIDVDGLAEGEIERQYRFRREGVNKITAILMSGDVSLTPRQGLRQAERSTKTSPSAADEGEHAGPWVRRESDAGQSGSWWRIGPIVPMDGAGPALVLVHGTFSKGDMYLAEFGCTRCPACRPTARSTSCSRVATRPRGAMRS